MWEAVWKFLEVCAYAGVIVSLYTLLFCTPFLIKGFRTHRRDCQNHDATVADFYSAPVDKPPFHQRGGRDV